MDARSIVAIILAVFVLVALLTSSGVFPKFAQSGQELPDVLALWDKVLIAIVTGLLLYIMGKDDKK